MLSRTEKYDNNNSNNQRLTRSQKNSQLYDTIYTNTTYTQFDKIETDDNIVDLSQINDNSNNKRENYQKTKFFNQENYLEEKPFEELKKSYDEELNNNKKVYDINEILESAKKNRDISDEIEKQQRIKNAEYSILSDLSHQKLKEYHDQKKKMSRKDEEDLEELINTITSNSLRNKIDDELLMDLMPEEESETIISKQLADEIEEYNIVNTANIEISEEVREKLKEEPIQETNTNDKIDKIDNSFYTKTLDLSEEDLDENELEEEDKMFIEDNKSVLSKILLVLFTLIVLAVIAYLIYTLV